MLIKCSKFTVRCEHSVRNPVLTLQRQQKKHRNKTDKKVNIINNIYIFANHKRGHWHCWTLTNFDSGSMVSSSVILLKKESINQRYILSQSLTDLSILIWNRSYTDKNKEKTSVHSVNASFFSLASYGENCHHRPIAKGEDPKRFRQTA